MKKQRLFCHKLITSFHFQGSFSVKREKKKKKFIQFIVIGHSITINRSRPSIKSRREEKREKGGKKKK